MSEFSILSEVSELSLGICTYRWLVDRKAPPTHPVPWDRSEKICNFDNIEELDDYERIEGNNNSDRVDRFEDIER